ncbi:hypothetical protein [Altererythrobacter lutimaris]|uniref:Uncharacterized protein n=1 Tax=Altererythrobacter lutimaris TaxID=2743979 RepID=A0A850HBW9_9SPHN|nr:hypothetical protein [Altererythrobacter lutimaris]NVE95259.1 hypothetical protein [Altererythrobacter lutimaris]
MSNPISKTRAAELTQKVANAKAEILRTTLVCSCAMALILAGRALPF